MKVKLFYIKSNKFTYRPVILGTKCQWTVLSKYTTVSTLRHV